MNKTVFSLLSFLLIAGTLSADSIYMKNGDTLTGNIESLDISQIVIKTSYGVLKIDRREIKNAVIDGIPSTGGNKASSNNSSPEKAVSAAPAASEKIGKNTVKAAGLLSSMIISAHQML